MAHAVVFDAAARVAEPSAVLRKRPVIIDPGMFATVEPFHEAMLGASRRQLRSEGVTADRDPVRPGTEPEPGRGRSAGRR